MYYVDTKIPGYVSVDMIRRSNPIFATAPAPSRDVSNPQTAPLALSNSRAFSFLNDEYSIAHVLQYK